MSSTLQRFRERYRNAVKGSAFDAEVGFRTRNAARQAFRAASDRGQTDLGYASVQAGFPGRGPVKVGPGGRAGPNEKPGVQPGETVEIDIRGERAILRKVPDDVSGFVTLGQIADVPSVAEDTVLFVEPAANIRDDPPKPDQLRGGDNTTDTLPDIEDVPSPNYDDEMDPADAPGLVNADNESGVALAPALRERLGNIGGTTAGGVEFDPVTDADELLPSNDGSGGASLGALAVVAGLIAVVWTVIT